MLMGLYLSIEVGVTSISFNSHEKIDFSMEKQTFSRKSPEKTSIFVF